MPKEEREIQGRKKNERFECNGFKSLKSQIFFKRNYYVKHNKFS